MLTLRPPRLARLATVLFAPHAQRPTLGHLQVRQQQARQCSTKFAEISIDRSALHNDDQSASASGPSVPREPETPLATELKTLIGMRGPITVAEYMTQALGHPQHGYYMRKVGGGTATTRTSSMTSPQLSPARLPCMCTTGRVRQGRRLHHITRDQPDVRRAGRHLVDCTLGVVPRATVD